MSFFFRLRHLSTSCRRRGHCVADSRHTHKRLFIIVSSEWFLFVPFSALFLSFHAHVLLPLPLFCCSYCPPNWTNYWHSICIYMINNVCDSSLNRLPAEQQGGFQYSAQKTIIFSMLKALSYAIFKEKRITEPQPFLLTHSQTHSS